MEESEKELHNLKETHLHLNFIENFFLFSSGVNFSILKHCPEEKNKFISIGTTIFLTAVLAALSGGYAFNFVFKNGFISFFFGIFWGIVIYNLDRYIVMSLRKNNSEKISSIIKETDRIKKRAMIFDKISTAFNTFLMALPRIIIAIIIALTVSKPIELRLFKNTIEKELGNIETNDISEFENEFKEVIADLNKRIIEINEQESKEKLAVYNNNPVYQNKLSTSKKNELEIKNINNTVKTNQGIIAKNKFLKDAYRNVTKYNDDGTSYISKEPYKYWSKNNLARAKDAENSNLLKRKKELFSEESVIKSELKDIEVQFEESIYKITENYTSSRKPIFEQIEIKNNNYPNELEIWKKKVRESTDLLSRLEALGNITGEKEEDGSKNSAYWSSFLITLLFISLETAPVIVKLLTNRGAYDELVDRVEYEYFINQQEAISKMNSRVNTILEKIKDVSKLEGQMFIKVEQQKLDAELKSNEVLLEEVAKKQAILAKLSINKWYKEERANFDV